MTMDRRPKVLVVTPDFPPAVGGIQTLVHRVVCGFHRLEPRLVTIGHADASEFDAASRVSTIRSRDRSNSHLREIIALNALAAREAQRWRPDFILCAHIVAAPACAVARRMTGAPVITYVYADELSASPWLARFALGNAACAIAISGHTRDLAVRAAPRARLEMILPGVDVPEEVAPERCHHPTILTVASMLRQYKGHDVMIRALPRVRDRVPDVRWVVVGAGPLEDEYRRGVAAAGLNACVEFRGRVSPAERDALFRSANVFAMPSRLEADGTGGEGFGIVYLEAGAHGLPVVAGNVGGALDAVVDGVTGVLVDPTDPGAVAAALVLLLTDSAKADDMGRAGRARAEGLTWPKVSARVERLLLSVAATSAPRSIGPHRSFPRGNTGRPPGL